MRGFTLIEALVVTALLCIIMALLMPALQNALASSRQSACANNQRQCGIGVQTYADDYHGHFTYSGNNISIYWTSYLCGATGGSEYAPREALSCPGNPHYQDDLAGITPVKVGTKGGIGGYGVYWPDDAGYKNRKLAYFSSLGEYGEKGYTKFFVLPRVEEPAITPLLADTACTWTAPGYSGHMIFGFAPNGTATYWKGAIQTLHLGRANLLFFDGHARSLDPLGMYDTRLFIDYSLDEDRNIQILPMPRRYR